MKVLSVLLSIALLVLAGQLATWVKPAARSPDVHSPALNSTFKAAAAGQHAETTP